jgi:hypothetical protein
LAVLAVDCVAACLFIAFFQGRISLRLPARQPMSPVGSRKPRARRVPAEDSSREEDLHGSIDPILDKISCSGLASLTPLERERLEKARHRLIAKDGGS